MEDEEWKTRERPKKGERISSVWVFAKYTVSAGGLTAADCPKEGFGIRSGFATSHLYDTVHSRY